MLIWIKHALTPKEIRERLLSHDSSFQNALIAYIESVHTGDFLDGSLTDVQESLNKREQ